jgi:hypothetical protein
MLNAWKIRADTDERSVQMMKQNQDNLQVLRMIWVALSSSILLYGFVLYSIGKAQYIALPEGPLSSLELASICMNGLILVTFTLHRNKISTSKEPQKHLVLYILCWSLNELVAGAGFAACLLQENPNAYFFALNGFTALIGNISSFPQVPQR